MHVVKAAMMAAALAAIASGTIVASSHAQIGATQSGALQSIAQGEKQKTHRVIIQVTQNDPAVMNMALNNAENLMQYSQEKGEPLEIEVVAYGAGVSMMRDDISPVKDRLAALSGKKGITFSGCGNTLGKQSLMEKKEISLAPQARLVASGIARVVELEEQGWTYVRP
jgi:hypothetical protein